MCRDARDNGPRLATVGFGNKFREWCNEAGLPHCSAHGLRNAGATIAADAGATEHQLMAIYGWELPRQAAVYTRKANRKRLAGRRDASPRSGPDRERNCPTFDRGSREWDKAGKKVVSYQGAEKAVVPQAGLEPARPCGQQILSLPRLPIPPLGHAGRDHSAR